MPDEPTVPEEPTAAVDPPAVEKPLEQDSEGAFSVDFKIRAGDMLLRMVRRCMQHNLGL